MKALDFSLPDQNGTLHSLSDYKDSWVVVYFYPKDDTSGCTTEACNFRDALGDLQKLGVVILGISKDSVESHKKFADKYHLNFPILSDVPSTTIKAYGAWTALGTLRKSFLIAPGGETKKAYNNVNPAVHAGQILDDVTNFRKQNT